VSQLATGNMQPAQEMRIKEKFVADSKLPAMNFLLIAPDSHRD
jgi:hypothetical protein